MAIIQNLVAIFRADTTAFESGTERARKSFSKLREESDKIQKTLNAFSGISRVFQAGLTTYIIRSLTDTSSSMMKARRHGDSMFEAFLAGIPIMDRLAGSADRLAGEISGLTQIEETVKVWNDFYKGVENVNTALERSLKLMSAGKEGSEALKAQFGFEDRLTEINNLDAQAEAIRKHNAALDERIATLRKIQTLEGMPYGQAGPMSFALPTQKEVDVQIQELRGQKLALPNLNVLRSQAEREFSGELDKIKMESMGNTSESEKLMTNMQRENELLSMNSIERAKGAALDKYREAVRRDIADGQQRSVDLTDEEIAKIESLAEEYLRLTEISKKSNYDTTTAMARMYGQFDKMSEKSYNARKALLDQQKEDYYTNGIDELAIEEWHKEQMIKLDIEYYSRAGRLADGFRAAGVQIRREFRSWSERGYEFSMSLRDSLASGLENMARDIDNWGEHFKNVLNEILWSAMRIAFFQPAGAALAGAFSGGIASLFGGGAGVAPNPPSGSPTMPDFSVPRLQHGGFITSPGLVYLHQGETVTPAGAAKAPAIVLNNYGPPLSYMSEPKFDGEKFVINLEAILADRIERNAGPLSRKFGKR